MNEGALLHRVGQRLRERRTEAGIGVAELAVRSEVSRRYLSDLEAGRANPSLLVLARLATGLGLGLADLIDVPLRRRPIERVALVGLRGAGKSSVGRELALALEVPFCELDEVVEALAGMDLGQVFELHGAAGYHRFEAEALEQVLSSGERQVLAVGGSVVESPSTYQRLLDTCRTVWLAAEPSEHLTRVALQGDRRPTRGHPRAFAELEAILGRRRPQYARAELQIETTGRPVGEVVGELLQRLEAD